MPTQRFIEKHSCALMWCRSRCRTHDGFAHMEIGYTRVPGTHSQNRIHTAISARQIALVGFESNAHGKYWLIRNWFAAHCTRRVCSGVDNNIDSGHSLIYLFFSIFFPRTFRGKESSADPNDCRCYLIFMAAPAALATFIWIKVNWILSCAWAIVPKIHIFPHAQPNPITMGNGCCLTKEKKLKRKCKWCKIKLKLKINIFVGCISSPPDPSTSTFTCDCIVRWCWAGLGVRDELNVANVHLRSPQASDSDIVRNSPITMTTIIISLWQSERMESKCMFEFD